MVSVEKISMNILRKVDILAARNVVNAQSSAVTPRTPVVTSWLVPATTSARRPNSATQMLRGLMGTPKGVRRLRRVKWWNLCRTAYHRINTHQNAQYRARAGG